MKKQAPNKHRPSALLSIAGFDGSGGAGVAADFKVCSVFGVHNAAVVTCLVIQDPVTVQRKVDFDIQTVDRQLQTMLEFYHIDLVNIGLVGNPDCIDLLIDRLADYPVVLDPILRSGDDTIELFPRDRLGDLKRLFPHTYLLTPNIPEAETILSRPIRSETDMQSAAVELRQLGPGNVLLTGGHLEQRHSVDVLATKTGALSYPASRARARIHGTGAYLNAAICAFLTKGNRLEESVRKAKHFLIQSIHRDIRRHPVLRPPAGLD